MKKLLAVSLAIVAVIATGSLIYLRDLSNKNRTTESLGLGLQTPTPSPTAQPGILALADVHDLVKPLATPGPVQTLKGGLQTQDISVGSGPEAIAGTLVAVHYTGQLADGTVFDSSVEKQPLSFVLGEGRVIEGMDFGVAGMKVGGKRVLVIPPALAYGKRGAGGVIPPNATLTFEVELLEVSMK